MSKTNRESKSKNAPKWKAFEELVAVIEAQFAPSGARVTLNDHIENVVTGTKRQVDASIRVDAGSTSVLITIEARNRSRRSDVRWIEELASKRTEIGAAKTIAVAKKGFSTEACRVADRLGIDLRTLYEITRDDIDEFAKVPGLLHSYRAIEEIECSVELLSGEAFSVSPVEPVFQHPEIHSPFPAVVFVQFAELEEPGSIWKQLASDPDKKHQLVLDGQDPSLVPVPLGHSRRPGSLEFLGGEDSVPVRKLTIVFDAQLHIEALTPTDGSHFRYSKNEEEIATFSSFGSTILGAPADLQVLRSATGNVMATAQFQGELKLPATISSPILTDMDSIDTSVINLKPIRLRTKAGNVQEGVIVKPMRKFIRKDIDILEFDAEYFIFVAKEILEKVREAAAKKKNSHIFNESALFIRRSDVLSIDLGSCLAERVFSQVT